LPIPSLNEQKKLAEIFSEKQAILERLSDVYTDKANEMRMLKESTLNQAFSGELVKE
jgi:restriction endonuclease S subunit